MTWQPSKQQLEDAALAGGVVGHIATSRKNLLAYGGTLWQPHLPTTQGKSDLQDLQLALGMGVTWNFYPTNRVTVVISMAASFSISFDNDKHAALAQAVIEVAAQVGAKMREGGTPC